MSAEELGRSYAYAMTDSSMEPRITNGEIVLADPDWPSNEGCDVVVTTTNGDRLIRTLLRKSDPHVGLGAMNNAYPEIELPCADIKAMEFVCGFGIKGRGLPVFF